MYQLSTKGLWKTRNRDIHNFQKTECLGDERGEGHPSSISQSLSRTHDAQVFGTSKLLATRGVSRMSRGIRTEIMRIAGAAPTQEWEGVVSQHPSEPRTPERIAVGTSEFPIVAPRTGESQNGSL